MAHRAVLTARQRAALFDLPTDEMALLRHYTLNDEDIENIRTRRRTENALQLCAFRYPDRLLKAGEVIPEPVSRFVAAQLGLKPDDLLPYAAREKTRREHLEALRKRYGYKMFSGKRAKKMRKWLDENAETAQPSEALVRGFVEECRRRQIILPGISVVERHYADALVAAERRVEARIAARLDAKMRAQLDSLLAEEVDGRVSRFIWLRQFEVGKNSADINRQLDRLEFLQRIALPPAILDDVPAHRIAQLRRQGERYFTDGLRDITSDRRLAILASCVVEWSATIADTVVETHDRIVGSIWREAKKICDTRVAEAQSEIAVTLGGLGTLGTTLLLAKGDNAAVAGAVDASCGWEVLERLVTTAEVLGKTVKADALAYVEQGYHRFKLYAPRMLAALDIAGASVAELLLAATDVIRGKRDIPSWPNRPEAAYMGLTKNIKRTNSYEV